MHRWQPRRWLTAIVGAALTALAIGIPTGIVQTSFYTRMTPVLWWNYPVWVVTSVLSGLILATYVARRGTPPAQQKKALAGGLLTVFAVGCPICNKLVVLALGVSGALTYFAPLQPILAIASLCLLGEALRRRLRAERACAMPTAAPSGSPPRASAQPAHARDAAEHDADEGALSDQRPASAAHGEPRPQ
jgi:hypothetical protein